MNDSTTDSIDVTVNQNFKVRVYEISTPKNNLPQVFDVGSLASVLGTTPRQLWYYVRFNTSQYSTFYIDKDTKEFVNEPDPTRRLRTINAPSPGLKYVQGTLSYHIFKNLPMHNANYAYMKGRSIKKAAELQNTGEILIRVDLRNFFPSHRAKYIVDRLKDLTGYSEGMCWFMSKLCCYDNVLPQGSVASPVLSIVLNKDMDEKIEAIAEANGMSYIRYADDITLSGEDRTDKECWSIVRKVAQAVQPFRVNWNKVDIMRNRAYRYQCGYISPVDIKVDGFKTKQLANGTYKVYRKEPLTEDEIPKDLTPVYYYVQDIKHMLGLNLTTEEVKVSRNRYNKLRAEAMLAGLGMVNEAKFKGRLAYVRSIEQPRAEKINAIYLKYRGMRDEMHRNP